jgi:hypothetical protein
MWTIIKGFFGGGSVMIYVYAAAAIFVGLLLWRNHSLGAERDHALEKVGAQQVVIAQLQANVDYAKLTVEKWQTASQLFETAVQEQSRVTYLASNEGRKLHVAFSKSDFDAIALSDPAGLESRRNLGWNRTNCLLRVRQADRGNCPAGPSAAGEVEPATPR